MMGDIKDAQNTMKVHLEKCVQLVEVTNKKLFEGTITSQLANHKVTLERKINDVIQLHIRMTIIAPMKAGKSTIINALIGRECLPSRSDAMTMLPTEVVLKPVKENSNNTPYLTLTQANREAICALHQEIKGVLNSYANANGDDKEFVGLFHSNVNIIKTAKEICDKDANFIFTWKQDHESHIREMLTFLNDLIRIYVIMQPVRVEASVPQQPGQLESTANATGKSSPSAFARKMDNDDILARMGDHIPKLEVSYNSLRTASSSLVNTESHYLILVDTPGPNEANASSVLRHVIRKELEKADVVLVTFNYTTLNTDTDIDIAKEINEIHKIKGNNDAIYALVNKVDQRRSSDMTEDEVKCHIASRYQIPENRIFELKAIHALRARRFFADYHKSTDRANFCQNESALDVLREAFPSQWKKKKDKINLEDLIDTAKELYEESGIEKFLGEAIDTLRKQVVRRCFSSAINTYQRVHKSLTESIQVRQSGLKLDAEKLNQERLLLKEDMTAVSKLKQTYDQQKSTILSEFRKNLDQIFKTHTSQTKNEIDSLFNEKGERWKNPSMWRDMVREQRFAAGTIVGAISAGVMIGAGIVLSAPVAMAAAIGGASVFVGVQAAGYIAEDQNQAAANTSTTPEPPNTTISEFLNNVRSRIGKVYAALFTKDEARFDTEAEANKFIDDVKTAANKISQDYYNTISNDIDQMCEGIANKLFLDLQKDSLCIIERTNERFNNMFQITRIVPVKFCLQLENVTSLEISPVARYRPLFGWWPFEHVATDTEIREKTTKHCIRRQELKKNCLSIIERNMMRIQGDIIERVQTAMQEQFEAHFKQLQDDLEMYLDDVRRSLDDKRKTVESQQEFMRMLQELLEHIQDEGKNLKLFESSIKQKWLDEEQID